MGFPGLFVIRSQSLSLFTFSVHYGNSPISSTFFQSAVRLISLSSICLNLRNNVLFKDAILLFGISVYSSWGVLDVLKVENNKHASRKFIYAAFTILSFISVFCSLEFETYYHTLWREKSWRSLCLFLLLGYIVKRFEEVGICSNKCTEESTSCYFWGYN